MIQKNLIKLTCSILNQKISNKIILAAGFSSDSKQANTKQRAKRPKEQDTTNEDENESGNFSSFILLSVSVSSFCLGVWQIKRAYDNENLIELLNNRMKLKTTELPIDIQDYDSFLKENEYKPFKVKGYFLNTNEIILTPRYDLTSTSKLPGGHVITPFVLSKDPSKVILINRGFVPYNHYSQNDRTESLIDDEVELNGILRSNQPECRFTPINRPPVEWHHRNVKEMSASLNTEPIFLDEIKTNMKQDLPIGGQTQVDLKNDHFSYILTWFGLSAASTFFLVKRSIKTLF